MDESRRFLRTRDAAAVLDLSPRTLEAYRIYGGGPPFCRPHGRLVRYRLEDLEAWMAGDAHREPLRPA